MVEPVIRVEHLRKQFDSEVALDDVSFEVAPGTVVGLLGPNGAGKTTLVHCLSTLLRPDAGTITVNGHDVLADGNGVRGSIALTGQFAAVDDLLSGRDNLVLFGRLLRLDRKAAQARAEELLTRFGLADRADKPVGSYSGGLRRRLDLAVSLVVPRPVLVLDEPTTGLDPHSRQEVWNDIARLRDAGVTVLLTTQYLEEADHLADRILILDHGRIIAEGAPAELKNRLGTAVCEVRVPEADREAARAALAAVSPDVTETDEVLSVPAAGLSTLSSAVRALESAGLADADVTVRHSTLEEVFLTLTEHRDEPVSHP